MGKKFEEGLNPYENLIKSLNNKGISVHNKFKKDLEDNIHRSGLEMKIIKKITFGMNFLAIQLDKNSNFNIDKLSNFEKLKDGKILEIGNKIYNICIYKIKFKKNIRIAFFIQKAKIYILHLFVEKNKSDYSDAIKVAKERCDSI